MNTKIFFKAAVLCLAMLAGSVTFSSCSDDDEDDPIEEVTNGIEKIDLNYSVSLSEDWYKFFDIEIKYTIGGTEEKTENPDMDWVFNMSIPYASGMDNYSCHVTAKPKADAPAIEAGATYDLGYEVNATVSGIMKDGSESSDFGNVYKKTSTKKVPATGMEKYITGEHKLASFSYTYTPENK